ncbi:MAG TPA: hypothetical protein V6C82_01460 [Chroococcales cyanobacterium]|jgi:hypothetical protein
MQVDIRIHLGSMLTLLGLLLGGYGIFSDPSIYRISLGINVNLYTGGLLLVLGLLFLTSALIGRSMKRKASKNGSNQAASLEHR